MVKLCFDWNSKFFQLVFPTIAFWGISLTSNPIDTELTLLNWLNAVQTWWLATEQLNALITLRVDAVLPNALALILVNPLACNSSNVISPNTLSFNWIWLPLNSINLKCFSSWFKFLLVVLKTFSISFTLWHLIVIPPIWKINYD